MGILARIFSSGESRPDSQYRLEWLTGDSGQGYVVVRDDGQRLRWQTLPADAGLESINVVGESHYMEDLQRREFRAGQPVALVPEPDNPHDPNAVAVRDARRRWKVGYIPADDAPFVAARLDAGEAIRAIVMWESEARGQRVSLRLLLIGEDADIAVPG